MHNESDSESTVRIGAYIHMCIRMHALYVGVKEQVWLDRYVRSVRPVSH